MFLPTPPRRRRTHRAAAIACGIGLAASAALLAPAAGAATSVPAASQVSGTVTNVTGDPIANACVFPIAEGQYTYVSGGLPGHLSELLPGMCTGSDGKYTVSIPPGGTQTKSISGLAVAPSYSYVGEIWPAAKGLDVTLRAAEATLYGQITKDSAKGVVPVGNSVVETFDATNSQILGVAVTDSLNGYFLMGQAAAPNVSDTVVLGTGLQPGLASALDVSPALPIPTPVAGVNATVDPTLLPSSTTITGSVTLDGVHPLRYQVVAALCESGCSSSTYSITDESGAFSFVVPRNAKVRVSAGGRIVPVNTSSFSYTVPPLRMVPKGSAIGAYEGAPTTWLTPSAITLTSKATWRWSGGSLVSGPDGWTRETATSTWQTGLTEFSAPVDGISQSATVNLKPGATTCLRITTAASDAPLLADFNDAGAVSCQSLPLDDRALKASPGWKKAKDARAYAGTLVKATSSRATLRLSHVTGHGLGIVWNRIKAGGAFTVKINGKLVKSVDTQGPASARRVTQISTKPFKGATVVISTTSTSPVTIDGLAVLP